MAALPVKLPKNISEWKEQVAKMGLTGQTIHGAKPASASKSEYQDYLLLRVLWVEHTIGDLNKLLPGMDACIEKANKMLKGYHSWGAYCRGFDGGSINEGTFAVARHYQLEVCKTDDSAEPDALVTPIARRTRAQLQEDMAEMNIGTPTRSSGFASSMEAQDLGLVMDDFDTPHNYTPSPFCPISPAPKGLASVLYPPSLDEQIVNCALVIFLNALTIHFDIDSNWTLHRKAFKAVFDGSSFEARVDGYLKHCGNPKVIIEVKPASRSSKELSIQMQESAQVVARIKSDGNKGHHGKRLYEGLPLTLHRLGHQIMLTEHSRLHLAQDRHEIYLTIAEYHREYVEYLEDKDCRSGASFMTMHRFGPFDTLDRNHIQKVGPVLLGISLWAESSEDQI